jgi:hypothetical protein
MEKTELKAIYGQVWDADELRLDFNVKGFSAPHVVVERKADQQVGTITFQHRPRYYFAFEPAGNMT